MKFILKTLILLCAISFTNAFSITSTQKQLDMLQANLNAIINASQKVSSTPMLRAIDEENIPGAGLLLQFFMLMAYVKPMAEATKKYYDFAQKEPVILCKNCPEKPLSAGTFFNSLTAIALEDLTKGKNNYDQMKKILDDSLEIIKKGTDASITSFMLSTANNIKFACPHCKGIVWEVAPQG
jgi:hypothetical protein